MLYEGASKRQANFSCYPKEHTLRSLTVLICDSRAPFKNPRSSTQGIDFPPPLQGRACKVLLNLNKELRLFAIIEASVCVR